LRDGFKTGFLYSRRFVINRFREHMNLNILDFYIKKEHYLFNDITSPNIFFYLEGALISGERENRLRGLLTKCDIFSYGLVLRAGINDRDYYLSLDIGYASGDNNPFDKKDNTFRFSTEFKEGLILFSELYGFTSAASSLRSYNLLFSESPQYFSDAETHGSISNAIFASLIFAYQFSGLFRMIGNILIAGTSEPLIDPYYTYISKETRNFFDSVQTSSLLGIETDFGIEREWYRNRYFRIKSLVTYARLFPGGAFENKFNAFSGTNLLAMKIYVDNL
ncbi:MAG: hypothetical protein N3B13_09235, partial [Deltaproteobacteria bacterium]|nr:hypothetical protein [Deltaproteobacteria bacterium]